MSFVRTRRGMSGVAEYTVTTTGAPTVPPKSRTRSLGSLGADEVPEMTEVQWRAAMLASQREVTQWQAHWVQRDELQRWMQLGATLAIPLSAAVWKMIFRAGRGPGKK